MAIPLVLRLSMQTQAAQRSIRGLNRAVLNEAGQVAGRLSDIVRAGLIQGSGLAIRQAARGQTVDTGLAFRGFATGALEAARSSGFLGQAFIDPIAGPVLDKKRRVAGRLLSDFGDLAAAGAKVSDKTLESYKTLYEGQEQRRQEFIERASAAAQLETKDLTEILTRLANVLGKIESALRKIFG